MYLIESNRTLLWYIIYEIVEVKCLLRIIITPLLFGHLSTEVVTPVRTA